jgi:hypothetical protein
MARFTVRRTPFGRPAAEDEDADNGENLPSPMRIRLAARRVAGIAEARTVLEYLPEPGESLHALVTARLDLSDVVAALLERMGRCEQLRIATLGYNERNLTAMLGWLDAGRVGSLSLVASIFFQSHKGALWEWTLTEFRQRGQRTCCCHSHSKVITLAFASGERFAIEGSANLCGNGSGREQFALIRSDDLCNWHSAWIDDLLVRYEGPSE